VSRSTISASRGESSVEEAIINALVAGETMTGANGRTVRAIPHDRLREVLKKYNRLVETAK
jgi:L-aminopeptidase/D-esterase-like protein